MRVIYLMVLFLSYGCGEFISSENIVEDHKRGWMWQDNVEVTYEDSVNMAVITCDNLILNGYIDWKLPTLEQLQTLLDEKGKEHFLNKKFSYLEKGHYWSETSYVGDTKSYWYVDFKTGKVAYEDKNIKNYIRCIREIK